MTGAELGRGAIPQVQSVAAVIVDYFTTIHALKLTELLRTEGIDDIVLVDNSVRGATRAAMPIGVAGQVQIVESPRNSGFGSGMNLGARATAADLIVMANPDTVPAAGSVERLVEALERDQRLALVGPTLLEANGSVHQSARAFPTVRRSALHAMSSAIWSMGQISQDYRTRNWDHSRQRCVDWVSGAFFVVRREAFEAVGGFDPTYFMYVEEVDLCWRLRSAGWRVGYIEDEVTHLGGASGKGRPFYMQLARHRSLWRFTVATTSGVDRLLLPIVATMLSVRLALVCSRELASRLRSASGRRASSKK
ncbi:MAG: glycosyltransferase family 2 protein [Acidimicrobiales bacterium]